MKKHYYTGECQLFKLPGTPPYQWNIELCARDRLNHVRSKIVILEKYQLRTPDELTGLQIAINGYSKIFGVPVVHFYMIAPGKQAERSDELPNLEKFLLLGIIK